MEITINTPALLFPAISLIMLAYTNRFLALSSVVRALHAAYNNGDKRQHIPGQIGNLKYRLRLIKNMQALGVLSFINCLICMYCIYVGSKLWANILFAIAMISFTLSLLLSLAEIWLSTKALELELSDMENIDNPSLVGFIKRKFDR